MVSVQFHKFKYFMTITTYCVGSHDSVNSAADDRYTDSAVLQPYVGAPYFMPSLSLLGTRRFKVTGASCRLRLAAEYSTPQRSE